MRLFRLSFFTLPLLLVGASAVYAQNGLDAYFGVGSAHAPSNNLSIDSLGTGTFYNTPSLDGAFGKAGADLMFSPHFGLGGEADFRFTQGSYAGLNYRPTFYDIYGIYEPLSKGRVAPQFFLGVGGANLRFFFPQSYCDQFAGCSTSNTYLESSNHFQTRLGFGLSIYATEHVFIRPQIDAHWVHNFFQFGSNWVPEYSISVGYHLGGR